MIGSRTYMLTGRNSVLIPPYFHLFSQLILLKRINLLVHQMWLDVMPVILPVFLPFATKIAPTCCDPPSPLCSEEIFWPFFVPLLNPVESISEPSESGEVANLGYAFLVFFFFPSLGWIKEKWTFLWEKLINQEFFKKYAEVISLFHLWIVEVFFFF